MIRRVSLCGMVVAFLLSYTNRAMAQSPSQTTLRIDLQNAVEYQGDIGDPSQFASKPNITPSSPPKNFYVATIIADIVAVNGQPVKGTYVGGSRSVILNPMPAGTASSEAIADVSRAALREHAFEILQLDGTPLGTIMATGFSGGNPPPGQPTTERANWAIVGGTGAFLGARGQAEGGTGGCGGRAASMTEDPANRRINMGIPGQCVLHIIPMTVPQIVATANGPAVTHSDFSLVTASKPAAASEILSLFATGLGPVRGVVTGQPFPSSPLAAINSPVGVTVNGVPAEVLAAVGYPGAVDGYQVNFRVPPDASKGGATIQVTAVWIPGPPVSIAIQ